MDMFDLGNQQLLQVTGASIVLATQPFSLRLRIAAQNCDGNDSAGQLLHVRHSCNAGENPRRDH